MILYTTMPKEFIFEQDYQQNNLDETILYNGIPLLVQKTNLHEYEIKRVLSTNPQHYLYCIPGQKITF
jgi:YlzJ-like protein